MSCLPHSWLRREACWGEKKPQGKLSSSFSPWWWGLGQHSPESEASHCRPRQQPRQPSHAGAKTRATSFQGRYSKTLLGPGCPNKDLPNKLRELLFIHSLFQAWQKSRWSLMFMSHGARSFSTTLRSTWDYDFGHPFNNSPLPVVFLKVTSSMCKWHTDLILHNTSQQELYLAWAVYELPFCLRLVFLRILLLALSYRLPKSLILWPLLFHQNLSKLLINHWMLLTV